MINNQKTGKALVNARSTSPAKAKSDRDNSPLISAVLSGALWGGGAALVSGLILITAMTFIAYANPDPSLLIAPMGLISLLVSSFAGGFVTAKRINDAPLLCGIVCGGMITVTTMLASIILKGLPSSGYTFLQSAALHCAAVAFAVLGAFAGNVRKPKKPGKKRFGR